MAGRFQIILSDPPWSYRDSGVRGAAAGHYSAMSVEDLCRLPVSGLAADDAALFMWATWPTLPDALRVIDAWGFRYKNCAFAWVKTYKSGDPFVGLGHWTRGNSEPCLFATRGKMKRQDASVRQLFITEELVAAPVGRHSAKPPEVRDRIVRLLGDLPRIELFARERVPGWHGWGLEYPKEETTDGVRLAGH